MRHMCGMLIVASRIIESMQLNLELHLKLNYYFTLYLLSRVSVTKTRVWIGESVYSIFTTRNYD
jgi:hypothetical protein